mmetsp:Transcript_3823/g.5945  ORF Transcript_3823/g.5945 Transcript_3823/m.5945 type:complete len:1333 (+) Transcript_3823:77-4075(+)
MSSLRLALKLSIEETKQTQTEHKTPSTTNPSIKPPKRKRTPSETLADEAKPLKKNHTGGAEEGLETVTDTKDSGASKLEYRNEKSRDRSGSKAGSKAVDADDDARVRLQEKDVVTPSKIAEDTKCNKGVGHNRSEPSSLKKASTASSETLSFSMEEGVLIDKLNGKENDNEMDGRKSKHCKERAKGRVRDDIVEEDESPRTKKTRPSRSSSVSSTPSREKETKVETISLPVSMEAGDTSLRDKVVGSKLFEKHEENSLVQDAPVDIKDTENSSIVNTVKNQELETLNEGGLVEIRVTEETKSDDIQDQEEQNASPPKEIQEEEGVKVDMPAHDREKEQLSEVSEAEIQHTEVLEVHKPVKIDNVEQQNEVASIKVQEPKKMDGDKPHESQVAGAADTMESAQSVSVALPVRIFENEASESNGEQVTEKSDFDSNVVITAPQNDKLDNIDIGTQNEDVSKPDAPTNTKHTKKDHTGTRRRRKSESAEDGYDQEEGNDADDESQSGQRSSRAAAVVAKSRLSASRGGSRGALSSAPEEGELNNATQPPDATNKDENPASVPEIKGKRGAARVLLPAQWVQCDMCSKWRSLPGDVDLSELPEEWFCSMNKWDTARNSCEKEEEHYTESTPVTSPAVPVAAATSEPTSVSGEDENLHDQDQVKRGGRGGSRMGGRGRRGRRGSISLKTAESSARSDNDDDSVTSSQTQSFPRKRRGRPSAASLAAADTVPSDLPPVAVEPVTWVQCNKCTKWRKVPARVDKDELPDVWYCAMNTWAPEYARCSAKEESDTSTPLQQVGGGRGRYVRRSKGAEEQVAQPNPTSTSAAPVKKVTQWVQCERKNCKKWRKIPGQVDLSTLPEKWFCEMNIWDPERATCDGAEETDSEGEQNTQGATRTQLILGNSKGPGTLSYRRLIFGTDGRVRPTYSERNKNGYGLFSFTEVFRPTDTDEYIMPTRRVGYWWSSLYDESGANYYSSAKAHRLDKRNAVSASTAAASKHLGASLKPMEPSPLIDTICRLSGWEYAGPQANAMVCGKWGKALKAGRSQGLLRRMLIACKVVKSSLLVLPSEGATLGEVFDTLSSAHFMDNDMEACRATMGLGELRDTLRRLEETGDVEAVYDNDGDLSFRLLLLIPEEKASTNPHPDILCTSELSGLGSSLPLKMRKRKLRISANASFPTRSRDLKKCNDVKVKPHSVLDKDKQPKVSADAFQKEELDNTVEMAGYANDGNDEVGDEDEETVDMEIEAQAEVDFTSPSVEPPLPMKSRSGLEEFPPSSAVDSCSNTQCSNTGCSSAQTNIASKESLVSLSLGVVEGVPMKNDVSGNVSSREAMIVTTSD